MTARAVKEKAAALLANGHYERAEVLLRQALTQGPRDTQTWLRHAEVLKRLGRFQDAVASYRFAARILDEEGHHPRAAAALKLALALSPDDVDLITDIIRSEMRTRKPGEAVRSLFVSSPSQLLAQAGSADAGLFTSSQSSVMTPQLALPMAPAASIVEEPPSDRADPAEARADTWLPDEEPAGLPLDEDVAGDAPGAERFATEPVPAPPPSAPVRLEVEATETWPQVRRLSSTMVAIRAAPTARWVVVESASELAVRFADVLEVPDDAEWLE